MDVFGSVLGFLLEQSEVFLWYTFILQIIVILMQSPLPTAFPQSSSLPHNGTLMAVYEKSGYSHSETSLSALIYLSTKVSVLPQGFYPACQ